MTFNDLGLIPPLLKALETEGYTTPTPIQAQSIPHTLTGTDLLGVAQTGTGKTAAFALPILQRLLAQPATTKGSRPVRCLILTPTRELAIQIGESFAAYGRGTGLKHTVIFGGVSQHSQTENLGRGIDILIATPGRLLDLMNQGFVHLHSVQIFVLDEADRMLDMGFLPDIRRVITKLPTKRQTLFFSATMPPEIQKLADTILNRPVKVEVTPGSSTAETVEQSVYYVSQEDKKKLLVHLLKYEKIKRVLVFARTKHGADKVVKDLVQAGIPAAAIHGNKSQNNRQKALSSFKSGEVPILIATDIAARGIDVEEVSHVINYELPNEPETYVHRIGRTGRAGNRGVALSFCTTGELEYLRDIQKLIRRSLPVVENHPWVLDLATAPPEEAPHRRQSQRAGGSRQPRSSTSSRSAGNSSTRSAGGNAGNGSSSGNRRTGNRNSGRPPRSGR